jgi:histidyl-tRNA synthetase
MALAEWLHGQVPGLRLTTHCGAGSFKSQFKKADRSGARYALVIGKDELERGLVGLKPLREAAEQRNLPRDELAAFLRAQVAA